MREKQLKISPDLSLPIDACTQTFAFIARKGAGKTYAAGKLVELLLDADAQVVILDTVGNWYGLRLAADGKGKGFDVPVFGGLRGDLPLEATAGHLVADVVVDTGRSIILDVSQFSLGERKRFATAFGEQLWKRKKAETHPSPLMLVIEESQLIIPQFSGRGGDDARMIGIYEEIIRLGRNYGIGCTMISQRPQSVNKEVLNQTECLFVLQVNGSQERKALKEWITHQGMDVHLVDELPALPIGTAYVWSPQWLKILKKVKIGEKITFDSTSTPKVGDKTVRRDPAPMDMADIRQKMAATIERAKENDPKALKAELAKVKADLVKLHGAKPAAVKTETRTVEKAVLKDGQLDRVERLAEKLAGMFAAAGDVQQQIKAMIDDIAGAVRKTTAVAADRVAPSAAAPVVRMPPRVKPTAATNTNGDRLPEGERIILTAAAQYPAGADREQLSVLAGYKRSTRDAYVARLMTRGYLQLAGGLVVATAEGVAALGPDFEPLPVGADLRAYWLNKLPEGERKVLEVLIGGYPHAVDRERIGESTGYKRSTRDAYIARLGTRKLVVTTSAGVVASETLF